MEEKEYYQSTRNDNDMTDSGPWKVFAIIGYVMGIVSLVLCFIPFFFFEIIPGIVFSYLGKNSSSKRMFADKGFIFNIVAIILNVVSFFIFIALLGLGYLKH